jgi:hypothetical protein
MSNLIPHNCPNDNGDEVLVPAGKLCPNDCGWLATDGDTELYAVQQVQAALEQWGPWLRLHEAADQAGVPFSTIAQAAREGRLPTLQLGRQKFVRLAAVLGKVGLHEKRGRPKSAEGEIIMYNEQQINAAADAAEKAAAEKHLTLAALERDPNNEQLRAKYEAACARYGHAADTAFAYAHGLPV